MSFFRRRKIWLIIILFFAGLLILFSFKTGFTISQVTEEVTEEERVQSLFSSYGLSEPPEKDPNRTNILLLGIRGGEDPGEGKFLSDAMVVISIDETPTNGELHQTALISFPRDLFVPLWCSDNHEKKKINFAYAYGGLDCAKKTISLASNLYIDYAVSLDFKGLQDAVDAVGGITVHLDTPFEENVQWAKEGKEESEYWSIRKFNEDTEEEEERWVFHIPKGANELDGETTLYYVRSRYSTNDFDRMRRQHQVLTALKEKLLSLGVLLNPVKLYNILDVLGKNVRTDANLTEIKKMIDLASESDLNNIKTKIFDISKQGLLYYTFINEEYVLLPVDDNFKEIQKTCLNIFN